MAPEKSTDAGGQVALEQDSSSQNEVCVNPADKCSGVLRGPPSWGHTGLCLEDRH